MASQILLLFGIFNLQQVVFAAVTCIGENGHPLDWFIVLKLPRQRDSPHPYVVNGLGYVYMDSSSYQFNMPDKPISSNSSSVGYTLQQIYLNQKRSGDLAYLMYDDKDARGHESFYKGHTKGVLGFDSTSGFWLVHSVPKFPPYANDGYGYPESGEMYGQSFLCVTFKMPTFDDIGFQLLYNDPNIYDNYIPQSLASQVPNITQAIDGKHISTKPYSHVTKMMSSEGVTFTSFAKSAYFEADLYHQLVAPFYNASLLSETWQNGEGKLPSDCNIPTVENVKDLQLMDISFRETEDHSKWAISKSGKLGLVCIGDINQMESQFKRGGGTLCVTNTNIWSTFHEAITEIEECSDRPIS